MPSSLRSGRIVSDDAEESSRSASPTATDESYIQLLREAREARAADAAAAAAEIAELRAQLNARPGALPAAPRR